MLFWVLSGVALSFAAGFNVAQSQGAPVTVTWQLSINVVGDATGTILTIDGASYTQSQFSGGLPLTAEAGSAGHTIVATTPVAAGSTKQYVFLTWIHPLSGLSASSSSETFTWPSNASTVTANYIVQYSQTLSYSVVGGGSPTPPTFTANQSGSTFSQTLTLTPTEYYLDSGSSWSVTNPLGDSTSTERWDTSQTTSGTISSAQTLAFAYYYQFSANFTYTVLGGGSPAAPTVGFTQYGSSTSVSASAFAGTQAWVDSGSTYAYASPLDGSTSTERWDTKSSTGSILATGTVNPSFYHQLQQTLSYSAVGGGTPTAPVFTANQFGSSFSQTLTTSPATRWFDVDSSWSVTPDPLAGSSASERWKSPTSQLLNGTISAAQTLAFNYYHQFQQTLSYSVVAGGSPTAPTFTANQFGTSTSVTLTSTASGTWFDAGALWAVTNQLGGSTSSQRWISSQTLSGAISAAQTFAFSYSHQYYLAVYVNPSGSGNTSSSGFFDNGCVVQVSATANPGYAFKIWIGSGAGSLTGTNNPASVTMSAAIIETAFFVSLPTVLVTVTSNPAGSGFLIVDSTPIASPHTFSWALGTTHAIAGLSPVSGNIWIQYEWQSWSDGGAQSHTIAVPDSSITLTATYHITINPPVYQIFLPITMIIIAIVGILYRRRGQGK
jgi:hypothetical protein